MLTLYLQLLLFLTLHSGLYSHSVSRESCVWIPDFVAAFRGDFSGLDVGGCYGVVMVRV